MLSILHEKAKCHQLTTAARRSSVTTFLLVLFSSMCVNSRSRSPLEISCGAVAVQAKRKSLPLRAIRRKCQQFQPLVIAIRYAIAQMA